jgi:putative resolvase
MKLIDYAHKMGISYKTAWRWYKAGKLPGKQMDTGTILVFEDADSVSLIPEKTAIYARVSSQEHKENLERQSDRLNSYCLAKGYQISLVIKEIASGVNDSRPKLLSVLKDTSITRIVVEHKDRLTRFGANSILVLLEAQGRQVEIVNMAEDETVDLMEDLSSIFYSFCARMYGQRRAKRKTEKIVEELEADHATG